jgi:hypothetical protein
MNACGRAIARNIVGWRPNGIDTETGVHGAIDIILIDDCNLLNISDLLDLASFKESDEPPTCSSQCSDAKTREEIYLV